MRRIMIVAALCVVLTFSGCGRKYSTGWQYNDPSNGGFERITFIQETAPDMVLIEGGL